MSFEVDFYSINGFNGLAKSKNLASRLRVMANDECVSEGRYSLQLGTEEQFGYGSYQMELLRTGDLDNIKRIVVTLTHVLEFEAMNGNI